jgi:azurin
MRTTLFIIIIAMGTTSLAAGCGKSNETSSGTPAPSASASAVVPAAVPPTLPTPSASASAAPEAAKKVELEIASVGDTMFYDKKTLTVPTGAHVHLTLKNNGKLAVMQHNWVLVKKGTEAKVALAGMEKAPDAGYVVPSDDVLAYTPLAQPQTTAEVTFTAPAPGDYPYICTFPGHYVVMKGVLTVTP